MRVVPAQELYHPRDREQGASPAPAMTAHAAPGRALAVRHGVEWLHGMARMAVGGAAPFVAQQMAQIMTTAAPTPAGKAGAAVAAYRRADGMGGPWVVVSLPSARLSV